MLPLPSSDPSPQVAKKFYFLEYFYVLLKGVQQSSNPQRVFDQFLSLKEEHQLGESRYKRLTTDEDKSNNRMVRYKYTFDQVLSESEEYQLIQVDKENIYLTKNGRDAIEIYERNGIREYNRFLFRFIEEKYEAFRFLVESCYNANPEKSGLLIFPVYSAYRLGIERNSLKKSKDLQNYFSKLKIRLEEDIFKHLGGARKNLNSKNDELIESLKNANLLPRNETDTFDAKHYNVILKRGRDFWLKYFLQDLYNYPYSLNAFETWAYRGRQIGIIHITEFYPDPNFSGRVVYPLSVIRNNSNSPNFHKLFEYKDSKSLYLHEPSWVSPVNQEEFVKALHNAYLDVRQSARTYFVNLSSVREGVCYSLKIPEYLFDEFLEKTYHERQNVKIRISLEVDKLPDETKVMYLRREPVMVDGKYRNIIAIDLRTQENNEGAIHE